ncbi:MAG TPA: hypothetical protein DG754_02315 [Bacteroidales bacterium]|jgi:hypothetical protein|nr:hypothetical protein [Bacteroidales bacterium]
MKKALIPILLLVIGIWLASCQKDPISSNPSFKLDFSTDTVVFDTVFTTIGSATRSLKVYNRNRSDINISSVRLMGGNSSAYRINVDGQPTDHARDILLRGKDSLFVFVEVTVDPTNEDAPMLVSDSIVFETNGNIQDVKLISWGQDMHLYKADTLFVSTTFTADKPYLIYDYLWVKPDVELTIEPGVRIHSHNGAWILVDGKLVVNGEPENPVVFEGDRLELFYRDKPGQWGGIWLTSSSHSNIINWAIISNAITGINILPFANPDFQTLTITNSIIRNMSYMAIDARGASIESGNCLFANAKEMCLSLAAGTYNFSHCTIANYWGQYITRTGPALLLANYYLYQTASGDVEIAEYGLEASFTNSIIYGSRSNEVELVNSYYGQPINSPFIYHFENSLIRFDNLSDSSKFINVIFDKPLFIDPYGQDFQLESESPAINAGLMEFALKYPFDLNNVSRISDNNPDMGAYEWVEEEEEE